MSRNNNTATRRSHFGAWLGVYALVLAAIIAVGLVFFWIFIRSYEQTRPAAAIRQYMACLDGEYLSEHARAFFDSLDERVQDREEGISLITQIVNSADYARLPGETDSSCTYVLRSGGQVIDTVTLSPSEQRLFGFPLWDVTQEEFQFDSFCHEFSIQLPEGYSVSLGGTVLDDSFIDGRRVPYAFLENLYDGDYDLPYMVSYHTGKYLGQPAVEVKDPEGRVLEPDQQNEATYIDNCDAEEKQAIESFIPEYIRRYVAYMGSHTLGTLYPTLASLQEMVLSGSSLESRLTQIIGMGFTWSEDELKSVTINGMMDIGGGYYVCDVTYYVETTGHGAAVTTTTNNAKLVMQQTDRGLMATAQVSY